jgi:pimeloyl-ACP methyl ester carboxylesterase
MDARPLDLQLSSGTLRAYQLGTPGAPAVVCVPGLSANARSFDLVAPTLLRRGRQVVLLDLRGRGFSPATAPGTYGWVNHAKDVLEVASRLGLGSFDLVGHSMGALVSMQAAALSGERIRRLVLVDTVGPADVLALPTITAGLARVGLAYPSAEAYCGLISAPGVVEPWEELWKAHCLYDLEELFGWVRPRTSWMAVAEDLAYGATHNASTLWPSLRMPTLLVRAARRLRPTAGFAVGAGLRDAFLSKVSSAALVEVDANHYEVMAHPRALKAIGEFVARAAPQEASPPATSASF